MKKDKKEKTPKKKPYRSSFSNVLWAVGKLARFAPVSFIFMILIIPIRVIGQYLNIYLPSLVVAEVTGNAGLDHALKVVGITMLILLFRNLSVTAMNNMKSGGLSLYRHTIRALWTKKALEMRYQDYEKKSVRELSDRAVRSTQQWNGRNPTTDIVEEGFGIVQNVLGYILFGTVLSFVSPYLIILLTIAPAVNYFAIRAYNKWEYSTRDKVSAVNRRLNYVKNLPQNFSNAKDIRIYGLAGWIRECFKDLSAEKGKWDRKIVTRSFLSRIADLVVILIRDGGAYALLIAMVLRGEITVDRFVLYFAAISSFASLVGGIINNWNNIHSCSLSICDLREFLDLPDEDGTGEAHARDHMEKAPEIRFDNVCFRYDGAEKDTLHDLSFTLHSGEKLALVGLNGAGKTTLVKLMCGLYTPTSGEIRIDGVPVNRFYRKDYYTLFSPVFQTVKTAFFTIAEHVSCTSLENTDIERVKDCLKEAGLEKKIASLPDGVYTYLDKQVNKNATELSGGEAQKLMLARALYKNAPVLVLDEPTSALDPIAESEIYQEYSNMAKGKSSLFISHRLASTSFCDKILYLENGSIAEEGTHKELIKKGGKYKELFDIQSCWYKDGKEETANE